MLLGELPAQPVPLINFRVGEFAFHGRTGDFSPLYTSGIIAGVLALFAVMHLILAIATSRHHVKLLNREIAAAAAPVIPGVEGDRAKRAITTRLAAVRKRLGLLGGSGGPVSPLDTLLTLSRALPSRMSIDIDELGIDDSGLKLNGKADSYATVEQVKKALSATRHLSDVQVSEEGPSENHKVAFRLTAGIKDIGMGPD
jgi:hypothetical protein